MSGDPAMDDLRNIIDKEAEKLLTANAPELQQEGDITVEMARKKWKIGVFAARRRLDAVAELTRIDDVRLYNGRIGSIWRKK